MPIYCFRCPECGFRDEILFSSYNEMMEMVHRIYCDHDGRWVNMVRDRPAEVPVVRGDIPPGFDTSIGMPYSGRRDKYTKYRESGHYPVSGGGFMGKLNRSYYGDEEYYRKVMKPYGHGAGDGLTDEMLAKQMDRMEAIDSGEISAEE